MGLSDILLLLGLALLLVALELDDRMRRRRQEDRRYDGSGLDIARVAPRIQQVRHDYALELRSHRHETHFREQLLASARENLLDLPFFRDRATPGGS